MKFDCFIHRSIWTKCVGTRFIDRIGRAMLVATIHPSYTAGRAVIVMFLQSVMNAIDRSAKTFFVKKKIIAYC
ncbi:MAG: hypothetical protein AB8G22_13990, partial [Saprospiraceae bacterium]